MSYSDILATVALAVSLLTAGWTAWGRWRWEKPVVSVSGTQWMTTDGQVAGFTIAVVNTGNQSTQITEAYWEIDRGNHVQTHFTASHGGGGIDSLFAHDPKATPDLPFTLARFERREWEFEIPLVGIKEQGEIIRARPVVRYTSRKKTECAYGLWDSSQIALNAEATNRDQ